MKEKIKVGFCVAYDWALLEYSLPCIYKEADEIWISMDAERKTWAGTKYSLDQVALQRLISSVDLSKKIQVYEDNFYLPELTTSQNEVRQRNKLAERMGKDGWHIQLDCDEYFINFHHFVKYLKSIKGRNYLFNVCCPLITLFKKVDDGYLYVVPKSKENLEYIQIATQTPRYEYGRRNGDFNIYTNSIIIHQSWARDEEEIRQKITNWGHNNDFDQEVFMSMWTKLNANNYTQQQGFHPIQPDLWLRLELNKASTMKDLLSDFDVKKFPSFSSFQLFIKNSLTISRLKKLWKKLSSYS